MSKKKHNQFKNGWKWSFPTISYVKIWFIKTQLKQAFGKLRFSTDGVPQSFPPRMTLCSFLSFRRPGRFAQIVGPKFVKFEIFIKRCTPQKFGERRYQNCHHLGKNHHHLYLVSILVFGGCTSPELCQCLLMEHLLKINLEIIGITIWMFPFQK